MMPSGDSVVFKYFISPQSSTVMLAANSVTFWQKAFVLVGCWSFM